MGKPMRIYKCVLPTNSTLNNNRFYICYLLKDIEHTGFW